MRAGDLHARERGGVRVRALETRVPVPASDRATETRPPRARIACSMYVAYRHDTPHGMTIVVHGRKRLYNTRPQLPGPRLGGGLHYHAKNVDSGGTKDGSGAPRRLIGPGGKPLGGLTILTNRGPTEYEGLGRERSGA